MPRKNEAPEGTVSEGKQLVNIGEERRAWIKRVADISNSPINEVFRCLIDQAAVEDPESFAGKILKYKLKMALADIERQEQELEAKKKGLISSLEQGKLGVTETTNHRG